MIKMRIQISEEMMVYLIYDVVITGQSSENFIIFLHFTLKKYFAYVKGVKV